MHGKWVALLGGFGGPSPGCHDSFFLVQGTSLHQNTVVVLALIVVLAEITCPKVTKCTTSAAALMENEQRPSMQTCWLK